MDVQESDDPPAVTETTPVNGIDLPTHQATLEQRANTALAKQVQTRQVQAG
jgi:hypothetical protein